MNADELPCPDCDGRGYVDYTDLECEDAAHHGHGHARECETCDSTGAVRFAAPCSNCNSSGRVDAEHLGWWCCSCPRGRAVSLALGLPVTS